MKKEKIESGASIFQRSANLIDIDPLEEIFELNLGDFITEHLISDELASKIAKHDKKDKIQSLKTQLKELISIIQNQVQQHTKSESEIILCLYKK